MDVKDKVIVVTGGADGIGAALCRRFAKDGARHVAVVDRNGDGAAAVAQEIGGKAYKVDVSNSAEVAAMVAAVEADQGRIDLLCANAGVGDGDPDQDNAASSPDAVWSRAFGVNVMHHVYAARAVLPGMIARGEGYIMNTVSAAGLLSQIGGAVYSTTKHAAVGFAESLAITHGDHGIKVSILWGRYRDAAPGRVGFAPEPRRRADAGSLRRRGDRGAGGGEVPDPAAPDRLDLHAAQDGGL